MESMNYYYDGESESESRKYSSSSSEEVDLGVGRSYECVFCKRGFNTAQALGGHMNIHRKDRARNKPNSTKPQPPPPPPSTTYYFPPPPASACNSTLYESPAPTPPRDWRIVLEVDNKAIIHQEKELDLELRLGYHS